MTRRNPLSHSRHGEQLQGDAKKKLAQLIRALQDGSKEDALRTRGQLKAMGFSDLFIFRQLSEQSQRRIFKGYLPHHIRNTLNF